MKVFRESDHPRGDGQRFVRKQHTEPESTLRTVLTREEVIEGLRDLVTRLRATGQPATIQLVGGVAIALTVDGDRPPTKDIDATITPPDEVRKIAEEVGQSRGWPEGWLDEEAAIFLPHQYGRGAEWVTLHDQDGVLVQAANPETLLAMKLDAVRHRPLRDADDVAVLLSATGVSTPDEAESIYDAFYMNEGLPPKVWNIVSGLLENGLPHITRPEPPQL